MAEALDSQGQIILQTSMQIPLWPKEPTEDDQDEDQEMKGDDETFCYAEEQAVNLLKELATAAAHEKFQQGSSLPSSLCAVLKALGATTLCLTTLSIPWIEWLEELLGILLDDAAAHA